MSDCDEKYITTAEVLKLCDFTVSVLYRRIHNGEFRARTFKRGAKRYFLATDVINYLNGPHPKPREDHISALLNGYFEEKNKNNNKDKTKVNK